MKHLSIIIIVVSLCVFLLSIGVYHKVPWSVLPIVASGICILCWLLFHLLCISEERDLLKEGNQYFIDTFQHDITNHQIRILFTYYLQCFLTVIKAPHYKTFR